jgi:hypothetical protein
MEARRAGKLRGILKLTSHGWTLTTQATQQQSHTHGNAAKHDVRGTHACPTHASLWDRLRLRVRAGYFDPRLIVLEINGTDVLVSDHQISASMYPIVAFCTLRLFRRSTLGCGVLMPIVATAARGWPLASTSVVGLYDTLPSIVAPCSSVKFKDYRLNSTLFSFRRKTAC